jgi:hypothetical protein
VLCCSGVYAFVSQDAGLGVRVAGFIVAHLTHEVRMHLRCANSLSCGLSARAEQRFWFLVYMLMLHRGLRDVYVIPLQALPGSKGLGRPLLVFSLQSMHGHVHSRT